MEIMSNYEFIRRAKAINGERYDFTKTRFTDSKHKITCTCNNCGKTLELRPARLLAGIGCKECYGLTYLTKESFIARSKAIYGDRRFDYSQVDYHNYHVLVKIKCNECGKTFMRQPSMHLDDHDCPYCAASEGVKKIWDFLDRYSLEFEREKSFPDLKYKGLLRYDFYIPSKNAIIEYHGELHYRRGFGQTESEFEKKQEKDHIKSEYAKNNDLKYIVIPYYKLNNWDKTVEMLKRELELPDHVEEHIDVPDNDVVQSLMDLDHFALNLENHLRQVHDGLDGLGYDIWSCPNDLKIEGLRDLLNIEDLVEKLGTKLRKYCRETQL